MPKRKNIQQQIYENAGGGEAGEAAVRRYEEYIEQYNDMMSDMLRDTKRSHFMPRNEKSSVTVVGINEDDYSEDSCSIHERNNLRDMQNRAKRIGRYQNYNTASTEKGDNKNG